MPFLRPDFNPAAVASRSVQQTQALADHELAVRYAPVIDFDRHEPFLPQAVGYTIFRQDDLSPSFPRPVVLPAQATLAIEYAIWWDWDIQHLYELEHVWVYVDAAGQIVAAEASWHGLYHPLQTEAGTLPLTPDGRLRLVAEPGKHALTAEPQTLWDRADLTLRHCTRLVGVMGLHVTPAFEDELRGRRNPVINALVRDYLRRWTFQPSFEFTRRCDLAVLPLVPWARLAAWIPGRVAWWMRRLYWRALIEDEHLLELIDRMLIPYREAAPATTARVWLPRRSPLLRPVRDGAWRIAALAVGLYLDTRRWLWQSRRRWLDLPEVRELRESLPTLPTRLHGAADGVLLTWLMALELSPVPIESSDFTDTLLPG